MANATVIWKEGMHFEGQARGHTLQMDAQPEPGAGAGMSPMSMVLVALGGCTAMDIVHIMQKEHQTLTGLTVEVEAERAQDYPMVFTKITLVYRLRGRGLSRKLAERAVELSEEKYCSVGQMLNKTAAITSRIEIEEETAAA
ncbi:MAG TPA: OsmC family protein [Anaerolineaceae bacterium]|nr:OsmC family protein [Anaerolineaceae bacterium]HPN50951.1 OsmC family protein [Anaerolineaceae bacterium]